MRIVLLSDVYTPVLNGVVHHVALLRRELAALGHAVTVIAGGTAQPDDDPGVLRYGGLPLGSTGYQIGWPTSGPIRAVLEQAEILHAHHPFVSGGIALRTAAHTGAPVLFTNHTRYDIYADVYLPAPLAVLGRKAVVAWMRRFLPRCHAVIAPSRGTARVVAQWSPQANLHVIHNGVDVQRFANALPAPRAALGLPSNAVVALYVGRLSAEKDVVHLLHWFRDAVDAGSPAHLALAGGGPQEAVLSQILAEWDAHHARRVHLLGQRPYAEMPALLATTDFFVTASRSESHPLTLIEAAAAGLPALGIRSPGVADVVIDGESGLLAGNGSDFVARFVALSINDDLRRKLGEKARAHSRTLSSQATARTTASLYESLQAAQDRTAVY